MTTEEFARGWYAGCRSLTQYLFEEFRARRRGAIPSMDTIRFDMLVEKHLEQVEPEEETSTPDNRDAPPAELDVLERTPKSMDEPLSIRIANFSATCKALEPDDEKCVVLHKLLDAWSDAALKLETALYDTRQYAAIRKVEVDDLRRQRDELKKREAKNGT